MTKDSKTPEEIDAMETRVQAAVEATQCEREAQWGRLYGEWLRMRATWAESDPSDDEGDRLLDREAEVIAEIAMMHAPYKWAIVAKLGMLENYMARGHSWADNREFLLLTSIKRDVAVS